MDELRVKLLPETRAFLRAWYHWATNGAPHRQPYRRDIGLCTSIFDNIVYQDLRRAFNFYAYPFGVSAYEDAEHSKTMHLDSRRLEWVLANAEPANG